MPRRFRKGLNFSEIAALGFVFIVALRFIVDIATYDPLANRFEKFHEGPVEVMRVIDGATIHIRQVEQAGSQSSKPVAYEINLKLIGADRPNDEAGEFAERFLSQGQPMLRLDKRRHDREGRLLGYIYVNEELLNVELVSRGLASASHYPGDNQSIARRLRKADLHAKEFAQIDLINQRK